ncbi:MAG: glycosyltransferase [Gammaproteobacteria bacterium]
MALRELTRPKVSVCVPFYNEEESIAPMHKAVVDALEPLGLSFEMVFVDDGSRDSTLAIAVGLAKQDSRVRVVKFRRNYGQTAAMAAGIEAARGDVIVTMDGDLQNDPRDIPQFLELMDQGYDIVVRLAPRPPGQARVAQDSLAHRQPADRKSDRSAHPRQRLLAEGVSRIAHQAHSALFGDASLHSGRGQTLRARGSPRSRCDITRANSANRSTDCHAFTRSCST